MAPTIKMSELKVESYQKYKRCKNLRFDKEIGLPEALAVCCNLCGDCTCLLLKFTRYHQFNLAETNLAIVCHLQYVPHATKHFLAQHWWCENNVSIYMCPCNNTHIAQRLCICNNIASLLHGARPNTANPCH